MPPSKSTSPSSHSSLDATWSAPSTAIYRRAKVTCISLLFVCCSPVCLSTSAAKVAGSEVIAITLKAAIPVVTSSTFKGPEEIKCYDKVLRAISLES
jgi:hypothetical protein